MVGRARKAINPLSLPQFYVSVSAANEKTGTKKELCMGYKRWYVTEGRKKRKVPRGAVLIYDDIEEIKATKGSDSLWPGDKFVHKFIKRGSKIYGLPDGSLLITGDNPLWDIFEYDD